MKGNLSLSLKWTKETDICAEENCKKKKPRQMGWWKKSKPAEEGKTVPEPSFRRSHSLQRKRGKNYKKLATGKKASMIAGTTSAIQKKTKGPNYFYIPSHAKSAGDGKYAGVTQQMSTPDGYHRKNTENIVDQDRFWSLPGGEGEGGIARRKENYRCKRLFARGGKKQPPMAEGGNCR